MSPIPEKGDAYLFAQDIFFSQFNDISFYVEDEDMENFYYEVLSSLFDDIKITKIFPLSGKANLLEHASSNIDSKKDIYITDKDFDDILGLQINQSNVFYLRKYSIENYLLDKQAVVNHIISEKPKLKATKINRDLKLRPYLQELYESMRPLILIYIAIQLYLPNSGIKNTSLSIFRFYEHKEAITLKVSAFNEYKKEVESYISSNLPDKRLKDLTDSVNELFTTKQCTLENVVPGKMVLDLLQVKICEQFALNRGLDRNTLCFKIAKESDFTNLRFLKNEIESFLAS